MIGLERHRRYRSDRPVRRDRRGPVDGRRIVNRRWLIVGLVLSLGLHGVVLWPLLTGSSSNEASEVAAESTPETVDVVAVAMPAPDAPAVAAPEPSASAVPDPPAAMPEEEPSASESGSSRARVGGRRTTGAGHPASRAGAIRDRTAIASDGGGGSRAPVERPPVNESITRASRRPWPRSTSIGQTRESGSNRRPGSCGRESRPCSKSSVVVEHRSRGPPASRDVRGAALPVVVEETRPVPRTTSRTAAMSESRSVATVTPTSGPARRCGIQRHRGRERSTPTTSTPTRCGRPGETIIHPERSREGRAPDRWRSSRDGREVAAPGPRIAALGGREARGLHRGVGRSLRWNPCRVGVGIPARVRIVDHVAAFQPVRSCLQGDERLASSARSVESIMEAAMQEAMRRRSMQPSEVAVCSGVLQPDHAAVRLPRSPRGGRREEVSSPESSVGGDDLRRPRAEVVGRGGGLSCRSCDGDASRC